MQYDNMTLNLLNYYSYLLVYAFIGWCSECVYCSIYQKHFVNRGFLNGPICPIYGFGALTVILLLMPFKSNPIIVFLLGILITSILEYFTSFILEKLFHAKWWDYSSYPYNINGRVCLKNSFLFGIMCLIGIYLIHPSLVDFVDRISFSVKSVALSIATIIIALDMIVTIHTMLRLSGKLAQLAALRKELEELIAEEGLHGLAETVEGRLVIVHTLKEKMEERIKEKLSERVSIWQRRLLNAFPDLTFAHNNEHFQTLKNDIKEKRDMLQALKNHR